MNEGNHISVAYIQAYLAGELSREETYSFEKELLRNSALSDAVEGLRALQEQAIELPPIQQSLQERLNQRITEEKKGILPFQLIRWSAAAVLLLCCGALGYWWGLKQESPTAYNALPSVATVQKKQFKQPLQPLIATRSKAENVFAKVPPQPLYLPLVSRTKSVIQDPIMLLSNEHDSLWRAYPKDSLMETELARNVQLDTQKRVTTIYNGVHQQDSISHIMSITPSYSLYLDSLMPSKEATETLAMKSAIALPKASVEMKKNSKERGEDDDHFSRSAIETSSAFIMYDGQMPKSRVFMVNPKKLKGWQYDPTNHDAQPTVSPEDYTYYIEKNARLIAEETKLKGIVKVKFRVNKDGTLSHFTILTSVTKELDEAALKIIKEGPNWMPKIEDGIVAKQWVIQEVSF